MFQALMGVARAGAYFGFCVLTALKLRRSKLQLENGMGVCRASSLPAMQLGNSNAANVQ